MDLETKQVNAVIAEHDDRGKLANCLLSVWPLAPLNFRKTLEHLIKQNKKGWRCNTNEL